MIADDPKEMATMLVQENGADSALNIALAEITRANEDCDYYSLSIWREIKGLVRDHMELSQNVNAGEPSF